MSRGKPKNISDYQEENSIRFYGPPTSCDDLKKLGYTLNGYYFVKHQPTNNSGKIRAVFCRFKMPENQQGIIKCFVRLEVSFILKTNICSHIEFETLIGNVEMKTKSVNFHVQRKSGLSKRGIIPFDIERLNVGGAMNLTSGVFTVPLNGTYHFQFSAVKPLGASEIYIILRVNGVGIGSGFGTNAHYVYLPTFSSASAKLKVGDQVYLLNHRGQLHDTPGEHFTQFNGWLVEEDFHLA